MNKLDKFLLAVVSVLGIWVIYLSTSALIINPIYAYIVERAVYTETAIQIDEIMRKYDYIEYGKIVDVDVDYHYPDDVVDFVRVGVEWCIDGSDSSHSTIKTTHTYMDHIELSSKPSIFKRPQIDRDQPGWMSRWNTSLQWIDIIHRRIVYEWDVERYIPSAPSVKECLEYYQQLVEESLLLDDEDYVFADEDDEDDEDYIFAEEDDEEY